MDPTPSSPPSNGNGHAQERPLRRAVPWLRWSARLTGLATIGLMTALMIGGGFDPARLKVREWILAAFFPLGLVFGLILGWRQEKLGGLISLGSLVGFYVVSLVLAPGLHKGLAVVILAVPGLLFVFSALAAKSGNPR
jgi:hypothetical protein